MNTATFPRSAKIEAALVTIMAQAVKSAVQLNNYPLSAVDVGCAFEMFFQDRKHANINRITVQGQLAALGYKF